jgi:hypothetical protein
VICFTSKLAKQNKPGGWTYLIVAATHVKKLKASKKTFRVKGTLDGFAFKHTSLLPLGDGSHFLPFNAAMRKATGKKAGDKIVVAMEVDESKPKLSRDLLQCLKEDPEASNFFKHYRHTCNIFTARGSKVPNQSKQKPGAWWPL